MNHTPRANILPGSTSGILSIFLPILVKTSELMLSWKALIMNQLSTMACVERTEGKVAVMGIARKAMYLKYFAKRPIGPAAWEVFGLF